MNRTKYFNYIEQKLGALAYSITQRGKLNVLDYHNHSENFYVYLMNGIYGFNFSNANKFRQNVEAIDLIDTTNKIIVQVSATNTKPSLKQEYIYLNPPNGGMELFQGVKRYVEIL